MTYVIAEPCVNTKDTACVEVCPVDCIHPKKDEPEFEAETKLYIDPETCICCDQCVPECPVEAIYAEDDVPDEQREFIALNAEMAPQCPPIVEKRKPLIVGAVVMAVVASIGAVGVPAGWYNRAKVSATLTEPIAIESAPQAAMPIPEVEKIEAPASSAGDAAPLAARRQREKDRARAREERAAFVNQPANGSTPTKGGPKKVAVTVSYDETGRVVQASGGDASALRIARQKRFPPGKAGSATVTIPIN